MRAVPVAVASSLFVCAVLAGAPQDPSQQRPIFRREANYVYVDAYVRKAGHIVEGLTAADFDVREDGKPQKIDTFEFVRTQPSPVDALRIDPSTQEEGNRVAEDPHNRVFVVYLDTFGTSPEGAKRAWPALTEFLRRFMSPTDLFGVLTPLTPPRDLVLGRRVESAESMLSQYWNWARADQLRLTPDELFLESCFIEKSDKFPNLVKQLIHRWRLDKVLSTLEETIARLGVLRDERKNLLLVSDGWLAPPPAMDLMAASFGAPPRIGAPGGRIGMGTGQPDRQDHAKCDAELARLAQIDFARRQDRLAEQANRANVSFYPIISSISAWPTGMAAFDGTPAGTLRRMAEDTDGTIAINDLRGDLAKMAEDLSAFYLMGYYSTNTATDGRFREIRVKVNRTDKDLTITARRGYLAPTMALASAEAAAKTAAAKNAPSGPPPAILDALKPLARLSSPPDVFTYGTASSNELQIVVELPSSQMGAPAWQQGADAQVNVAAPSGSSALTVNGRIAPATRSTLVRIPLEPGAAGPWRVTVQVSARSERLEEHATIAATSGALLGGPILYRASASPRSPLSPVADFLFRRIERVHVEWPILQALDDRQVRVLTKSGQVVASGATLAERETNGQSMLAVDLALAPLSAGDYVIEATAVKEPHRQIAFIAFRVTQ